MMTVSMPSTAYYSSDAKNSYAPIAAGQTALMEQRSVGQSVMKNSLLHRPLDANSYGSQSPSIPSASLSAAIASSLSLGENHQGLSRLEDVPLELLSRNISFHRSPSAPLDVLIKSRIEKMPNSLVLVNNSKTENEAVCPNLRVYQQEDAHEYLLGILSKMEDGVLAAYGKMPRATMDTNVIRRIFGGTTRSEGGVHVEFCDSATEDGNSSQSDEQIRIKKLSSDDEDDSAEFASLRTPAWRRL
ncbi:unnamed protein product [Dibothriocephalus latus]|uniref:Uncharacterized protein n=1 Tax=Dibothriocephalus latus TaxID=60516 RepID=A0A3P6VE13_DIBLA|nr:unnamed protein product [Dibothriocephalus latus]